jgi:hypothetical protein
MKFKKSTVYTFQTTNLTHNSFSCMFISILYIVSDSHVPIIRRINCINTNKVFPCFFLSCKANARVKLAKTGHGQHSSTLAVICVVQLLFVLFYVLFVCKCVLPPGGNPTSFNKYIILSHVVYNTLYRWLISVQVRINTPKPAHQTVIYTEWHTEWYTRCRIGTINSPDDGHVAAPNV